MQPKKHLSASSQMLKRCKCVCLSYKTVTVMNKLMCVHKCTSFSFSVSFETASSASSPPLSFSLNGPTSAYKVHLKS